MRMSTFIMAIAAITFFCLGGALVDVAAGVQKFQHDQALADKWGYTGLSCVAISVLLITFISSRALFAAARKDR